MIPDVGDETTTGELARNVTERYLPNVRLFGRGEVMTNIGILQETGHPEPWVIAMECAPTRAAVMDYGSRWAIEPTFSDFKSRGFELEDSQLQHPDRPGTPTIDHGISDALVRPYGSGGCAAAPDTPGKKTKAQTDPLHWSFKKLQRSRVSWFTRGLRYLKRLPTCKMSSPCRGFRLFYKTCTGVQPFLPDRACCPVPQICLAGFYQIAGSVKALLVEG